MSKDQNTTEEQTKDLSNKKLKLWILDLGEDTSAWDPWFDKCFGSVICASTEEEARKIADENGAAENYNGVHPWLNSQASTCTELKPKEAGVVIEDIANA